MAGIKAYRKLQMGPESTAGTTTDATSIWRGTGTIQDNLMTVFPTEDIGILTGVDRSYISRYEAQLSLDQTEATFQQLPYLFEMGMYSTTSTTDANGYLYTYTMPTATSDAKASTDLGTYQWEGGDNQQCESFNYGFVRSFNLSGEAGGALMMSAEIIGRQVATDTFTASLSIPTVQEILFSKGKLYIDAVKEWPATTQKSNTLLAMDLSVNTGWTPVYTADGNLYFSFVKQVQPEVTLTLTFEHDSTAVAEIAAWRAGTPRLIRISFDGTTTAYYLYLDLAGKWDNFEKIGERDGNDIVVGTLRARYNSTVTGMFRAIIGNGLEALP